MRFSWILIFAPAVIALAAAKPSFKRENYDASQLQQVLRKLVSQSSLTSRLSHQTKSAESPSQAQDNEEECTPDATLACPEGTTDEEFFMCAIQKGLDIEKEFKEIFKSSAGHPLFNEAEDEFFWQVYASGLLGYRVMEMVEGFADEIAYNRFAEIWDDLDQSVQDRIEVLGCTCEAIKKQCENRM